MTQPSASHDIELQAFVKSIHGIRYQVRDVARAVAFYTQRFGFKLEHQQLPAFASVSLGDAQILLSGPGASGSRPMPNGKQQEPGGWNRIVLKVADLPAFIAEFKKRDFTFATRWRQVPAAGKSKSRIPTEIRSSCSNRLADRGLKKRCLG